MSGPRPTFGAGDEPVLEAYLLDFSGDLYDHVVEVEFIDFVRPDHAFDGAEALAAQMADDCRKVERILTAVDADDPLRRFTLGNVLADRTLDCGEAGC